MVNSGLSHGQFAGSHGRFRTEPWSIPPPQPVSGSSSLSPNPGPKFQAGRSTPDYSGRMSRFRNRFGTFTGGFPESGASGPKVADLLPAGGNPVPAATSHGHFGSEPWSIGQPWSLRRQPWSLERVRHSRWYGAVSSALVSRSRAMPVGDRRSLTCAPPRPLRARRHGNHPGFRRCAVSRPRGCSFPAIRTSAGRRDEYPSGHSRLLEGAVEIRHPRAEKGREPCEMRRRLLFQVPEALE